MADPVPKQSTPFSIERDAPAEHFIRTFESDAATLKSGGTPGFTKSGMTPASTELSAEDRFANAAAARGASESVDIDTSAPVQGMQALTADMMPIAPAAPPTPKGAFIPEAPPTPAPIVPPVPTSPAIPEAIPASAAALHTYTSDFADAVTETNATPTTILAAEEDAAPAPVSVAATKRNLNTPLIAGAVALILLGGGGAYAAYWYTHRPTTVPIIALVSARIFVDDRQEITGKGSVLEQALEAAIAKPLNSGSVRLVYTPTATSTDQSVFSALQLGAPDILLRNITATGSMAGVRSGGGSQSPFFILAVQSYGDTFAGMLAWEPTMQSTMKGFYPLVTNGTSTAPALPAFKDRVVSNHDARLLQDTAGNTLIIYGYWDAHTLIIARDETAFTEIIGRLANSRTAQ